MYFIRKEKERNNANNLFFFRERTIFNFYSKFICICLFVICKYNIQGIYYFSIFSYSSKRLICIKWLNLEFDGEIIIYCSSEIGV